MKRRRLIHSGLAFSTALIAGCIAESGDGSRDESTSIKPPDNISSVKFQIIEGDGGDLSEEGVLVSCEVSEITIRRWIEVGSSECNKARPKSISFHSNVLTVLIDSGYSSDYYDGEGCTDDISEDKYEIVISLPEKIPNTVRVKHEPYDKPVSSREYEVQCTNK